MLFRVARSLHTRAASAVGIFGGSFDPPTLAHLKVSTPWIRRIATLNFIFRS